jgi:xylulose-5-phosphate/fructose-6-phosphate phosphoketolase
VLNNLDCFHRVMDTMDQLSKTGDKGSDVMQQINEQLLDQKQYIDKAGQDMPDIRN